MFYGHREGEEPPDDQDLVLMPSLVDKVCRRLLLTVTA